jgi:outer membrane lipoprotein SlyB
MKRALVAVVIAGSLFSFEASAQERAGSAALGAVAGAIMLGPIGAVAGAFIGYSAASRVTHSREVGRSASRSQVRREAQAVPVVQQQATTMVSSPASIKAPDTVAAGKTEPPVQGFD